MAKVIQFHDDARRKVFAGMEKVANAVMVTMGPKGKNVLIEKSYGAPTFTNDGVTVAKEISFEDKYHNVGAEIIKEAAEKTNKLAGDGTTSTTVLTYAIAKEWLKYIENKVDPFQLVKGLHFGAQTVVEEMKKQAKHIKGKEEIQQVATLSAQDEKIGQLIADVMDEIGKDGTVTVEESKNMQTDKVVVTGMQFDSGFGSPYFKTNETEAVINKPYILITDKKISSMKDILPILEGIASSGKKDVVIIADDVDGEALANLVLNKVRGILNVLTVKAPGFGDRKKEMLKDIAAVTGATVITDELGLKLDEVTGDMLGQAEKVIATKDKTTIIEGKGNQKDIDARISEIKAQIATATSDYDREKLQERLAKLAGGVAVIRVGAATEMELKNKKFKVEDALNATKAAVEEGIVAGWGITLVHCLHALDKIKVDSEDQKIGIQIIKEAIQYPLKKIAENAWYKGDWVVESVKKENKAGYWFNAKTWEFGDLLKQGIIDPVKVVRLALEHAVSAAAMFLTTDAVIVDAPKKEEPKAWGAWWMGGMGDMDMY